MTNEEHQTVQTEKATITTIKQERLAKAEVLRAAGQNPYAVSTRRDTSIADFIKNFDTLEQSSEVKTLAGRVMAKRGHGALIFIDLYDGTRLSDGTVSRTQALVNLSEMDEAAHKLFADTVDTGDFIEITGTALTTKRGAQSLSVKSWKMLTKSLLPLPKEHFGIKDEDERYRKRYLDMILSEDAGKIAMQRSIFWNTMRTFLLKRGYIEVETPILENIVGGGEADPFVTHHNALDIDVFLRISPELWHKKLMIAGVPKVFEIGRIFRNEGMDAEHLQDYTQLEFYEAYSDYTKGMVMIQEMYREVVTAVLGTTKFSTKGYEIDLDKEWETYHFCDILKEKFNIDPLEATLPEALAKLTSVGIKYDPKATGIGKAMDLLWKSVRKEYTGPGFLIGIPKYLEPLAKVTDADPRIVERFQVILAGSEMGKAFSELNDPVDQKERFEDQQKQRDAGDEEAQMNDTTFVEALEHGMPPTFGFGIGERLFSFLLDVSVREAQLFPLMRPKTKTLSKRESEALYRSHKIVVIANEELPYGVTANAIGQLGISIGMFSEKKLYDTKILRDADNRVHYVDGFYPMTNLAGDTKQLTDFVMKCYDANIQIFDFSTIMRKAHSDKQMIEGYKERTTKEIEYIAVGALVPTEFEKEFLGNLELFGNKNTSCG